MKYRQNPLRVFLFASLLLCLLTGLTGIARSPEKVNAAPQMQATSCVGNTISQWTFESTTNPSIGSGTFSAGSGLTGQSYDGGSPGQAVSFTGWTNKSPLDVNDYVEFAVPTVGRNSIGLSFDYRASGTGPSVLEIHYSVDGGTNFTILGSPTTILRDTNFYTLNFDFTSITQVNDNASSIFRIYGYSSGGGGGTLRFDDVTFTGNCLFPADTDTPTATATATDTGTPTSTSTATNTLTATATATNTSTPGVGSATSVVISEFRTRGPSGANDEYIELYNPTSAVVDISGWKINVSNDDGSTSTRATIPSSTILRSGQYYLVANNNSSGGYSNSNVLPNLTYGTGISDNGGVALLKADNTPVDRVGLSAGSAYKEGTHVSLSPSADQSYERKVGGASDSCVDTNDNANDFIISSSDPKNYSSQLSRCGTLLPIPVVTTTTITADTPDPSLVNANVSLSVKVTGGSTTPSGVVNITGSNSNCSITLNSSGTGSCTVRFTSTGTKTLTATYLGDQTHFSSTDTESHQVATVIRTPTATRPPTAVPPPPLVAINEFVPRPGHDWNNDGEVNVRDEYVEIINHGTINVNLSGYSLDDEANIGSAPYRLPAVTIRPGERIVFYGSDTGLLLSDGGDGVRLLKPNGQLMDAYNYRVARYSDQSYCRLPDDGGLDDWNQNCYPTPGLQNSLSGGFVLAPNSGNEQLLCPIADTLPEDFVIAECAPYGNNIWRQEFWDAKGWYNEKIIPGIQSRWDVFAD